LRKAQSPAESLGLAKTGSALGRVLLDEGQYQNAIAVLNQAQQIQSLHEEAQADFAATLVGLSDAYFYLSRYPEAES
jgi:tetratricopeptide (TPR) repeat protein